MFIEAVFGLNPRVTFHPPVSEHFGNYRCGHNFPDFRVTFNYRLAGCRQGGRKLTVYKDGINANVKVSECSNHGEKRGVMDIDDIDLFGP